MMGNERIQRGIRTLGLAVLLGAAVVCAPPAAAQQTTSQGQMERCIAVLEKQGAWPPPKEVFGRVQELCRRGDPRGAYEVIQEAKGKPEPQDMTAEQCIAALRRQGDGPLSKEVYDWVREYCRRRDLRDAYEVRPRR
jgi:hypothetical protein